MHRLQKLIQRVEKAYDEFEFHVVFHSLHNFCAVDMSAFYLDILKDRLYTAKTDIDRTAVGSDRHACDPLRDDAPHGAGAVVHRGRGLGLHEGEREAKERVPR